MRFVIYKNSVLATICSMFGAVCIAMAIGGVVGKEIGILPAVGMIAAGIGLMWLASAISDRKARKKQAKAAAAKANNAYGTASGTKSANVYSNSAPVENVSAKPVKKSVVLAGVFSLLAAAFGWWACNNPSIFPSWNTMLNSEQVLLAAMGLVLAVAAFRTRHIQKVSVLFVIGFLGLTLGSVDVALCAYRDYGFGGYSTAASIHYMVAFAPVVNTAAYFLMTLFALFSMQKIRKHLGSIVKVLWWLPAIALMVAFVKWYDDNGIGNVLVKVYDPRWIGLKNLPREALEMVARLMMIVAAFLSGSCFRRLCKKPAEVYRQESYVRPEPQVQPRYAEPEPQYRAPEPQPEPRHTAPEPPRPAPQPQTVSDDVEKKLKAYKDLLECGILSLEEYEQKLRELKRG